MTTRPKNQLFNYIKLGTRTAEIVARQKQWYTAILTLMVKISFAHKLYVTTVQAQNLYK